MDKKRLLMVQPGAYGDILMCLPIAKYYYDQGYEIIWPVRKKFANLFRNINYVKHLIINDDNLSEDDWMRADFLKITKLFSGSSFKVDKAFCLCDRRKLGEALELYGQDFVTQDCANESFIEFKYRLADVPIDEITLEWERNRSREQELFHTVVTKRPYSAVHDASTTESVDFGIEDPVYLIPVDDYNIFD